MTNEQRAKLIKTTFLVLVLGIGVVAGLFVDLPGLGDDAADNSEETGEEQEARKAFEQEIAVENRLTVMNMTVDGNPDSEKLEKILSNFEQQGRYGPRVAFEEFEVEQNEKLAEEEGVNLEEFEGQLNFYAAGQRLGSLRGETDPKVVDATIQRYLRGLVKRFGPGWLPEVEGMRRASGNEAIIPIQPADPRKP